MPLSKPQLAAAALVVAVALVVPAGAGADGLVAFQGTTAVYNGAPGEAHALVVSQPIGVIEFREPGVIAGSACNQVAPDRVQCPRSVATAIKVVFADEDDTLDAAKGIDLPVDAIGAGGDDVLKTGVANDILRGGPGNDRLEPSTTGVAQPPGESNALLGGDGDDTFVLGPSLGADTVAGGGGVDTADYSGRPPDRGGVACGWARPARAPAPSRPTAVSMGWRATSCPRASSARSGPGCLIASKPGASGPWSSLGSRAATATTS